MTAKGNNMYRKHLEHHEWMTKYYGQLKGAVIENVTIAIVDDNHDLAFPRLIIKLANGKRVETEIVSLNDEMVPGIIYGLPWSQETFINHPILNTYFLKENNPE